MDSGDGTFKPLTPEQIRALQMKNEIETTAAKVPDHVDGRSIFQVGEILEIKKSRLKVTKIGKRFMTLQLLPKE